jgi:hypothetical protein
VPSVRPILSWNCAHTSDLTIAGCAEKRALNAWSPLPCARGSFSCYTLLK